MKNSMKRFQEKSCKRKITDFLHFKVSVDLFKFRVLVKGLFQLVQNNQVSVNVSAVMLQRVLVEISQNHVSDFSVITI